MTVSHPHSELAPPSGDTALATYEALAPLYDAFTAGYAHEAWLANVDALVRSHGVVPGRVLDVGCGTGKSFLPLRSRGWEVTACDLSPAMVARAKAKLPPQEAARVSVADMRRLPDALGQFDLVTCLDDGLNHLLSPADLNAAMCSMASRLRPGGLLVFDLNSRAAYRDGFDDEVVGEGEDVEFQASAGPAGDGLYEVRIEAVRVGGAAAEPRTVRQLQRYFASASVETACGEASLRLVDVRGQVPGGRLVEGADEELHPKVLYVARKQSGEALEGAPAAGR